MKGFGNLVLLHWILVNQATLDIFFSGDFFIRVYFEREAITEEENLTFVQPRSAK